MNLKSLFTGLVTALTLAPQFFKIVDDTVKQVEADLVGFDGSAKLKAVEAKVNSFLSAASDDLNVVEDLKAILVPTINAAVALFNAAGIFTHKSTPTPKSTA